MNHRSHFPTLRMSALACAVAAAPAFAAVSADEAAQLKTTLTPLGAERAGDKDGTIPAWTGGYTTPLANWTSGARRPDPFAADKPLYSVSAKNMAQVADKLSDGTKEMFKRYPATYRMDVYTTRRTAMAPEYVYENTLRNATHAQIAESSAGPQVKGALGGIPFPIPKTGVEVMWNSLLTWRGVSTKTEMDAVQVTTDGRPVLTSAAISYGQSPYYYPGMKPENFKGAFMLLRLDTVAPAIRAGEAIAGVQGVNPEDDSTWVYLTGQRRVRKLPNACCDAPTPATAGLSSFDELQVYSGRLDRFEWKLLGKRELLVPYNSNRLMVPTSNADVIRPKHLNPDFVRWELHRMWVVEATLAPGKRHMATKSRYYIDEDSWAALLAERYDAQGRLWKHLWSIPYAVPDMPGISTQTFGFNDFVADSWFVSGLLNEKRLQMVWTKPLPETFFNPNSLAGESR